MKKAFLSLIEDVMHFLGFKHFLFPPSEEERLERAARWAEWEAEQAEWIRQEEWTKAKWKRRPALVHKSGSRTSLYVGQKFNPQYIDLVDDGWTHDHCEVCYKDLYETEDPEHGVGYTNGSDWICSECYSKYVEAKADSLDE